MKKKILALTLFLSVFLASIVTASSINGDYHGMPIVKVRVNGSEVHPEVPGHIEGDGTTLLPLRAVTEALGATVTWHGENYSVDVDKRELSLSQLNKIGESVGLIYALDASGQSIMHGSGFLLDGGVFITNYHVAGKASSFKIILNGTTYTANGSLFKDETEDLFAIKINASGGLNYSTELPQLNSHVYTVGYPHTQFKLNEGKVLYLAKDAGIDMVFTNARVEEGSSGGVLVDDTGNVIGVTSGGSADYTVSEAIQMKYVKAELDKLH